jgi:hypothetical protein
MIFHQEFGLIALAGRRLKATSDCTLEELLYHLKMANTKTEIHVIILMLCFNFG